MKVSKIRQKLEQFLEVLEDIPADKDIKLRSNTYMIAEDGDFFLGFSGYDGGYLTLSDIEETDEDEDHGFESMDEFIYFLYYEEIADIILDASAEDVIGALSGLFYDDSYENIEVLYYDFFVSDSRKDNIQYLVEEIEELILG